MRRSLFALMCLLIGLNSNAQTEILNKFVNTVNSFKSLSYTSVTNNESPLGDTAAVVKTYQGTNKLGQIQFEFKTSNDKDVFDGKDLISIHYIHKYYRAQKKYSWTNTYYSSLPLFVLERIANKALKSPQKIVQLSDTVIKKTVCYHIKISISDTIVRNKRSYSICDIYLNKTTYLPAYAETNELVYIEKGGVSSRDAFKMIYRNTYSDYLFNQQRDLNTSTEKIPSGFLTLEQYNNRSTEKSLSLLTKGTKAPDWKLKDLKGKYKSSFDTQNKVLLIDFFGNSCAPCIMALPAITRLHEKYKNDVVEIVSIDIDNGKDALKFAAKYKLKYPVYANGKAVSKDFHVGPIPTFYLINKQGNVANTYEGYSDELEKSLITEIDKLK